jgi:hypothetical protein
MTKKQFREQWEQVFINYTDAELYALSVWIHQMKAKNHWNQWVGQVTDAYMAHYTKHEEQLAEETQPADGQPVH